MTKRSKGSTQRNRRQSNKAREQAWRLEKAGQMHGFWKPAQTRNNQSAPGKG